MQTTKEIESKDLYNNYAKQKLIFNERKILQCMNIPQSIATIKNCYNYNDRKPNLHTIIWYQQGYIFTILLLQCLLLQKVHEVLTKNYQHDRMQLIASLLLISEHNHDQLSILLQKELQLYNLNVLLKLTCLMEQKNHYLNGLDLLYLLERKQDLDQYLRLYSMEHLQKMTTMLQTSLSQYDLHVLLQLLIVVSTLM